MVPAAARLDAGQLLGEPGQARRPLPGLLGQPPQQQIRQRVRHVGALDGAGRVTQDDVVYDLGSGDGRVVITAVQKFGAHAVGVEFQPDLCRKAEQKIHALGIEDHARIIEDSVFRVNLSPATVVTMFFLTSSNERLKPNLEKYLKPGSRVVSNQFPIKGWKPASATMLASAAIPRARNAHFCLRRTRAVPRFKELPDHSIVLLLRDCRRKVAAYVSRNCLSMMVR